MRCLLTGPASKRYSANLNAPGMLKVAASKPRRNALQQKVSLMPGGSVMKLRVAAGFCVEPCYSLWYKPLVSPIPLLAPCHRCALNLFQCRIYSCLQRW